jgi:hypothetical protein
LAAEGLSVLALLEGPGEGLGLALLGDALGLLGDGLGLALLTGRPEFELLGDGLGLVLLGDGLVLLGDGLGLVLLGDGLGLLGTGLGSGLLAGLGLEAAGPVVEVAQADGVGLAVVVALVAGLAGVDARPGCCVAQLAELVCW